MINLEEIGKKISKLRTEKNMSQQELADALYVTHQAVSKWENGKGIPSIEIMVSLTKLFSITIDYLLGIGLDDKEDFSKLLKLHSREYVVNQLILGKLDFKIVDVIYLLSNEEREIIISHIINQHLKIDLLELLPYLNQVERKRILLAVKEKRVNIHINEINHMLAKHERILIFGGKNGY